MTKDEIDRLIQREPIVTYRIDVNVDGLRDVVTLAHDPTLRRHMSRYDRADVARRVRHVLHSHMVEALEVAAPPSTCPGGPYETVELDDRSGVARRARWAAWRLDNPHTYKEDTSYSAAKDRGLLVRLLRRADVLDGAA